MSLHCTHCETSEEVRPDWVDTPMQHFGDFDNPEFRAEVENDTLTIEDISKPPKKRMQGVHRNICLDRCYANLGKNEKSAFLKMNYWKWQCAHIAAQWSRDLPDETVNDLAAQYQSANEKYEEWKKAIFFSHIRTAHAAIKSNVKNEHDYDDMFNEIALKMIMCVIDKFDPHRGTQFSTYVYRAVRNKVIHEDRMKKTRGLLETEMDEYIFENCAVKNSPSESPVITATDAIKREIESCLDTREQDIILRNFGLGESAPETLTKIGKSLRISRERVRQIKERALCKLEIALLPETMDKLHMAGMDR